MTKEQMERKARDLMAEAFELYEEAENLSYYVNLWTTWQKESKSQMADLKAFYAVKFFEKAARVSQDDEHQNRSKYN